MFIIIKQHNMPYAYSNENGRCMFEYHLRDGKRALRPQKKKKNLRIYRRDGKKSVRFASPFSRALFLPGDRVAASKCPLECPDVVQNAVRFQKKKKGHREKIGFAQLKSI